MVGAVYVNSSSNPVIRDCSFVDNKASRIGFDDNDDDNNNEDENDKGDGGGIFINTDTEVIISNSLFDKNRAYSMGGGICNLGSLNMDLTDFTENIADIGGGMYDNIGTTKITNCNFGLKDDEVSGNLAHSQGGGIYNYGVIDVRESWFYFNEAKAGGAVVNNALGLSIGFEAVYDNCDFVKNEAWEKGGAVYNYEISPEILDCLFLENYSKKYGGAIFNSTYSSPYIYKCSFNNNSVSPQVGLGGAIANSNKSNAKIEFNTFQNNNANNGGAIFNFKSNINLYYNKISKNTSLNGGAIFNDYYSNLRISDCKLFKNESSNNSIIFNNVFSKIIIVNSLIYSNFIKNGGVIRNQNNSDISIINSTITKNKYEIIIKKEDEDDKKRRVFGGGTIKNYNSAVDILNSIIWKNIDSDKSGDKEITNDNNSSASITYSCIKDKFYGSQPTNTNSDPQFIAHPNTGDFFLHKVISPEINPCIGTGDPNTSNEIKEILAGKLSALSIETIIENETSIDNYITEPDIILNNNEYLGDVNMGYHYDENIIETN